MHETQFVQGMALLRVISAAVELSAALLMLYIGRLDSAFRINAVLGLVGPGILLLTSSIGLVGLAGTVPAHRLVLVALGVGLILAATR